MSTDQPYYNTTKVILDGTAKVYIDGQVEFDGPSTAETAHKFTIKVVDCEGRIAQELVIIADKIIPVR